LLDWKLFVNTDITHDGMNNIKIILTIKHIHQQMQPIELQTVHKFQITPTCLGTEVPFSGSLKYKYQYINLGSTMQCMYELFKTYVQFVILLGAFVGECDW
jgi:hypothetical protein